MGCYPSILMCPWCHARMKQRNLPQRKTTVCVHCGRRYPVWEARFFVLNGGGRAVEVTESIRPKLECIMRRYGKAAAAI